MAHGEFAVRGSLLDLFPMGGERRSVSICSIARSTRSASSIRRPNAPAKNRPDIAVAGTSFRRRTVHRALFAPPTAGTEQIEGDPQRSLIYQGVSDGRCLVASSTTCRCSSNRHRHAVRLHRETTLVLFTTAGSMTRRCTSSTVSANATNKGATTSNALLQPGAPTWRRATARPPRSPSPGPNASGDADCAEHHGPTSTCRPAAAADGHPGQGRQPGAGTQRRLLANATTGALFVAETAGRREALLDTLRGFDIRPQCSMIWHDFVPRTFHLHHRGVARIRIVAVRPGSAGDPEALLLGERVTPAPPPQGPDADQVVRNLAELAVGAPVVHEDHGVGRFLGLQTLDVGGQKNEFLTLEYARGDKLYVPVSSLNLISRYTGASPEAAPLHRLGSDQWEKARKRRPRNGARRGRRTARTSMPRREAIARAMPCRARRRLSQVRRRFRVRGDAGPAERDRRHRRRHGLAKTDGRVVCGDVGFGKTEVAMRAAFIAANAGKQVLFGADHALLASSTTRTFRPFRRLADQGREPGRASVRPKRIQVVGLANRAKSTSSSAHTNC